MSWWQEFVEGCREGSKAGLEGLSWKEFQERQKAKPVEPVVGNASEVKEPSEVETYIAKKIEEKRLKQ